MFRGLGERRIQIVIMVVIIITGVLTLIINNNNEVQFLRDDNFAAGNIRRFISMGGVFKGSPIFNTLKSVVNPDVTFFTAIMLVRDLPGFEFLKEAFFTTTLDFNNPNAVADLTTDSVQNKLVSDAVYPSGRKAIRFSPFVGIATDPINENPTGALIWEVIYDFLQLKLSDRFETEFNLLNPAVSDLIVPDGSQRNGGSFGTNFDHHTHAIINVLNFVNETASPSMASKVAELLTTNPRNNDPAKTDFIYLKSTN